VIGLHQPLHFDRMQTHLPTVNRFQARLCRLDDWLWQAGLAHFGSLFWPTLCNWVFVIS